MPENVLETIIRRLARIERDIRNLKAVGVNTAGGGPSHPAVTVVDTTTVDLSLSVQQLSADLKNTAVTPGSYTNADITIDSTGRITAAANGTGGETGSGIWTLHADGSAPGKYPFSLTGITDALSDAASNPYSIVEWQQPGDIDGSVVIPANTTCRGKDRYRCHLHGQVDMRAGVNSFVYDLRADYSASSADPVSTVLGPTSGKAGLDVSVIAATNTGTGPAYGIQVDDGDIDILDCIVDGEAASGTGVGVFRPSGKSGEVNQYGGQIIGSTYNVAGTAGGSDHKGAQLATGSIPGDTANGIEVSSLSVGDWYCVESSGGPWYKQAATPEYIAYSMSASLANTFDSGVGMGWDYEGWHDLVPSWGTAGARVGDYYYRFFFQATQVNIYLWPYDGMRTDNAPGYSLTYTLYAGLAYATDVDAWYHVSAVEGGQAGEPLAGDRAAYRALDYPLRHTDDTDNSAGALHHTLGTGANQAAAGNHTHSTVPNHDHSGDAGDGSAFEILNLATAETDTAKRLAPDGAGGVAWSTGGSATDADAIHDNVASEIHAITEKATPNDADEIIIEDSADSYNKKRVQISSLPSSAGGISCTIGLLGSIPAGSEGDLYIPTDAPYLMRKGASAWQRYGPLYKIGATPTLSDFAWINQGSTTCEQFGQITMMNTPAVGGTQLRIMKKATPATPYTITMLYRQVSFSTSGNTCGLCLRESSSGKLIVVGQWGLNGGFPVLKFNNTSSWNSNYNNGTGIGTGLMYLRIYDNGTTRYFYYSYDGYLFNEICNNGRTDFITADEWGFFVNSENASYGQGMEIISLEVT